ncbi:MAG: hypothetical protein J6U00_05150 [Ruminococcus sp.]|uniref:hypothetical protein n=1 Tax=Ruminococcus sp. TaxID=41978 RepID=UPI001B13C82B|nr:hypothetical protein [Ruminococcus sp.]MBO7473376.1 hypothetical protein [Ruminococcus sp.]
MIVVKAKPSKESIVRLYSVTSPPKRTVAAFAVLLLIILTTLILSIIYYKHGDGDILFVVTGAVMLSATLIFLARILRYPAKRARIVKKNALDLKYTYTFTDADCIFTAEGTGISSRFEQSYSALQKAVYREGWFVVIFGTGAGIAFHENSFTQGTPQQLSAILREKLGKKYKVK